MNKNSKSQVSQAGYHFSKKDGVFTQVVAIGGNDDININPIYDLKIPYFKRELVYDASKLFTKNK